MTEPTAGWHRTDFRPHPLLPTRPIPVDATADPEMCVVPVSLRWGDRVLRRFREARIRVESG
jgi:hypothetical protein